MREKLLELAAAHPDLPIVPMVDREVVGDDCHTWWLGSVEKVGVIKYYVGRDYVWIYEYDDEEDILNDMRGCKYGETADGRDICDWVDSKGKKRKTTDTNRYKALGNSIALPFWEWMAARMVKELGLEHPTMGSLFDGIGGFPLAFSRCGCDPVWASEIEEFCIAVTKRRFG